MGDNMKGHQADHRVFTWLMPLSSFVAAATAVRAEDESEEKKETSMMELLELVVVCCVWAMSGCNIKYYDHDQYWKNIEHKPFSLKTNFVIQYHQIVNILKGEYSMLL